MHSRFNDTKIRIMMMSKLGNRAINIGCCTFTDIMRYIHISFLTLTKIRARNVNTLHIVALGAVIGSFIDTLINI